MRTILLGGVLATLGCAAPRAVDTAARDFTGLPVCPNEKPCLRPRALLGGISSLYPDPQRSIPPAAAVRLAAERLSARGAVRIEIIEADWIAAPLTAYLITAIGQLRSGEVEFRIFRLGLRDGYEQGTVAGEEVLFIAVGKDANGERVWDPPPGPDWREGWPEEESVPERLLAYELLAPEDRLRLESLLGQ